MCNLDDEVEIEEAEDDIVETTRDSTTSKNDTKKRSFFLDFDTGEVQSNYYKITYLLIFNCAYYNSSLFLSFQFPLSELRRSDVGDNELESRNDVSNNFIGDYSIFLWKW